MNPSIVDQVVDFYDALFKSLFAESIRQRVPERLKRNTVMRDVAEAADAASQSLSRFFRNRQLDTSQVADILSGFDDLHDLLSLEAISNPNVTPESLAETLLVSLPYPAPVQQAKHEAIYRITLHSVLQVLMLVGPVMAEWQRLEFATTFELPRRVTMRLNQITEQLDVLGQSRQDVVDENYELDHRDYLLQRFYRVEAGTVRMTTNLNVDVRELFVMPRLKPCPVKQQHGESKEVSAVGFLDLAQAREVFGNQQQVAAKLIGVPALVQVKRRKRNVIIGLPGSGKSTFLEWLQLQVAAGKEEFLSGGQQAIPLMLRVRELDAHNLPWGAALIEKATASRDRATLMPQGWIERQMQGGRVLFLLDGLDETEPELRDEYILPWLQKLCDKYKKCAFVVSSRPVGYTVGALEKRKFAECELLDFGDDEIAEYTRHWCTAVRLAQNEPEQEARREGTIEGEGIVSGFRGHPHISHLARNPLMLSAICLVNYFEHGELPKDRATLYRLCVEGLLHHWDQRRGIHSEFTLDEKLRGCREVAIAMQADDRAEYEVDKVQAIFARVFGDAEQAAKLLEHIRYRTGLLMERRAGVFGFAHLTFQEYLAALAVREGNLLHVDAEQLAREHDDGRWNEVIALYCGLSSDRVARTMIECLITWQDTQALAGVLSEAYASVSVELVHDVNFRQQVLERIAIAPSIGWDLPELSHYGTPNELAAIANKCVGKIVSSISISTACKWLGDNETYINDDLLVSMLRNRHNLNPIQLSEVIWLAHQFLRDRVLVYLHEHKHIYMSYGPQFSVGLQYSCQAEIALIGITNRASDRRDNRQKNSLLTNRVVASLVLAILEALGNTTHPYHNGFENYCWHE